MVLESLSLNELEAEQKRVENEIKRIYCTRTEKDKHHRIAELARIKQEVEQGIKEIRSIPLHKVREQTGAGIRQTA